LAVHCEQRATRPDNLFLVDVEPVTQAPPGGFGLAAPPSKKSHDSGGDPLARKRGEAAKVAAVSVIKGPDQAKLGGRRTLDKSQLEGDAEAPADAGGAADPFAAPVAPTQSFLDVLQKVWTMAGPVNGKLGGPQLRPIMMMSKLDNVMLGQ
jgi:hypothetical protein